MKYKLSKENLKHIGKVFLYSAGSAVIGVVITMIGDVEIPSQYLFLGGILNTFLVGIQEYLSEKR